MFWNRRKKIKASIILEMQKQFKYFFGYSLQHKVKMGYEELWTTYLSMSISVFSAMLESNGIHDVEFLGKCFGEAKLLLDEQKIVHKAKADNIIDLVIHRVK